MPPSYPLVLLSFCCASLLLHVPSVALSSCATLLLHGWLLRVMLRLSPYCLAPLSCPLVAPAGCCVSHTSVALSCCTALLSSCCASWLLSVASPLSSYCVAPPSLPLVVHVASVVLSCCTALLSSCCTSWLLRVMFLPYHLALPSCPLVVAG